MAAITINLPDELENKFRKQARLKFGDKQGKLSRAATEAIEKWCEKEEN